MSTQISNTKFFGWHVMWAAFTVALFGWGVGFYGPPIFLHTVVETRGWAVGLALGTEGWALAAAPWQLSAATLFSAVGWAGTGAMAYNGASVGGVLFSPVWVFLIALSGFPEAAMIVGIVLVCTLCALSARYFSVTPQDLGTVPDGEAATVISDAAGAEKPTLPGRALWTNRGFLTYMAGFSFGLFAQIGIIAHLFSLLVPALGTQGAGFATGFAMPARWPVAAWWAGSCRRRWTIASRPR